MIPIVNDTFLNDRARALDLIEQLKCAAWFCISLMIRARTFEVLHGCEPLAVRTHAKEVSPNGQRPRAALPHWALRARPTQNLRDAPLTSRAIAQNDICASEHVVSGLSKAICFKSGVDKLPTLKWN